ncbi:hypothetical protein [Ferruginibacter sp.]
MGALETAEIVLAGAKHVEDWLSKNEYTSVKKEFWQKDSIDIHADSAGNNIFIQVHTALQPNGLPVLKATDKFAVKEIAHRMERTPYMATLVIDDHKNLVGEIVWHRLTGPDGI